MHIAIHTLLFAVFALIASPLIASRASLADNLLAKLYREAGVKFVDDALRAADLALVDKAVARYGSKATQAFEEAGYGLLQAARSHGPETVELAARVPGSARYIAAYSDEALKLARQFGDEAIAVQIRTDGLLTRRAGLLGKADIRTLAEMPVDQAKTLAKHLELVDSPETAAQLMVVYRKSGIGALSRLPKNTIIAGGVITAGMVAYYFKDELEEGASKLLANYWYWFLLIVAAFGFVAWLYTEIFKLPGRLMRGLGRLMRRRPSVPPTSPTHQ
jgi:hypothetical protein